MRGYTFHGHVFLMIVSIVGNGDDVVDYSNDHGDVDDDAGNIR